MPQISREFDPEIGLPSRLQRRLDGWKINPPISQFEAYGPLNAYLTGNKFPTNMFLVKPQKLLRPECATSPDIDKELNSDDYNPEADCSFESFDSSGMQLQ
jgi:hypothetical protein